MFKNNRMLLHINSTIICDLCQYEKSPDVIGAFFINAEKINIIFSSFQVLMFQ